MKLVFATNNSHKLFEVRKLFKSNFPDSDRIQILSLNDILFKEEIPETGDNIEDNASQKAWFIYNKCGMACFADDTGLEITSLGGRPGVYSARYAGENISFDDNMNKVLSEMKGITDRRASFRTAISLVIDDTEYRFEGRVDGEILESKKGSEGFGYDPIFKPEGKNQSFAEMPVEEKNLISHRGRAFTAMIRFLKGRM